MHRHKLTAQAKSITVCFRAVFRSPRRDGRHPRPGTASSIVWTMRSKRSIRASIGIWSASLTSVMRSSASSKLFRAATSSIRRSQQIDRCQQHDADDAVPNEQALAPKALYEPQRLWGRCESGWAKARMLHKMHSNTSSGDFVGQRLSRHRPFGSCGRFGSGGQFGLRNSLWCARRSCISSGRTVLASRRS
jgi:hypothetical protein